MKLTGYAKSVFGRVGSVGGSFSYFLCEIYKWFLDACLYNFWCPRLKVSLI